MKSVFADTFYWAALTSADDTAHVRALEFSRSVQLDRIVTTDEVLVEYLAFFASARPSVRIQPGNTVAQFLTNSRVQVIHQSRDSFLSGLEMYRARPDKGYSLTDCISMPVIRRERLAEALTNDHHFEQEGFKALFRY